MSRSKSHAFEAVRREIARRLQAGLPLAGMIAATTLLCGCGERPGRTAGVPAPDPKRCEQKSGQPKPEIPVPNKNNETCPDTPMGDIEAPPSNPKDEPRDPASTKGRSPAKKPNK